MKTTVKHFNELTPEELYGILQLRERVFTFEQRCSEPDLDGFDKVAYHIFLTDENGTEACLRMLPKGVLHDEVSFGRIVAAKRRQGLGAAVVKAALQAANDVFDADTVEIQCRIHTQSADIALGTNDEVGGAGDQGMMFGGACTQTPELMPLPAALSRALCSRLTQCVHETDLLRPDGKTQVTVEFDEQGNVVGIDTVVVSIMHSADFEIEALRKYVRENVIAPVLERYGFHIENVAHIHINPTGNFVIGGPNGDTGLTGRKIIVDTYGGYFSHGGGAFSGKDPTKVDRSAAYMARYMAKNLVAAGLATKVQVQLAYAIGVAEPVSVRVDSFGTGVIPEEQMTELLRKTVDMTPAGIIKRFDLRRPIYADTAAKGHFGVEGRPWERTDLAEELKQLI